MKKILNSSFCDWMNLLSLCEDVDTLTKFHMQRIFDLKYLPVKFIMNKSNKSVINVPQEYQIIQIEPENMLCELLILWL